MKYRYWFDDDYYYSSATNESKRVTVTKRIPIKCIEYSGLDLMSALDNEVANDETLQD